MILIGSVVPGAVSYLPNVMKIALTGEYRWKFSINTLLKFHLFYLFCYLDQIVSHKHENPIEVVIVTTILTIRIRCPKTVNLFNKAHQHMRGTSCTKFTL